MCMRRIKDTMQYFAFFQKNENGGYTVTVPSLPGLVTEGRTLDEANIMVRDAIKCYLAGLKKAKEIRKSAVSLSLCRLNFFNMKCQSYQSSHLVGLLELFSKLAFIFTINQEVM